MRKWLTSGLLRKILLALLVVSLIPLLTSTWFALESYQATQDEVVAQSKQDLDQKSFEGLKGRTLTLAQRIASFLQERETDLQLLASLPRTPETFANFARTQQSQLWTVTEAGQEFIFNMPLYREVSFIDNEGQELIKVTNECEDYPFSCSVEITSPAELVDVSNPANTLYQYEPYFAATIALERNGIYVGRPIGAYVPYQNAYAGAQNRGGDRYRGVLRFAQPVYEGNENVGIVVLAMEMLHLIELTAHVAPANPAPQAEIDAREADFAYMIDPEGWAISHPRHFNIVGVDDSGELVPPISEENRDDPDNLYRPGNLAQMGFIAPGFPELVAKNQNGEATQGGTLNTRPWGGQERAMAYATIPYHTGRYNDEAGFGLVILSTDGARFHLEADLLGKQIENRITALIRQVEWITAGTVLVGLVLAFALARNVAWPILRLTTAAHEIEEGRWENADIDDLAETKGGDEVAALSRVFASMAKEVRAREQQLRQQVQQLQIVLEESKLERQVSEITETDFFQDLSEKAQNLRERRRRQRDQEKGP